MHMYESVYTLFLAIGLQTPLSGGRGCTSDHISCQNVICGIIFSVDQSAAVGPLQSSALILDTASRPTNVLLPNNIMADQMHLCNLASPAPYFF